MIILILVNSIIYAYTTTILTLHYTAYTIINKFLSVATVLASVQMARGKYDWCDWIMFGPPLVPFTIFWQLMAASDVWRMFKGIGDNEDNEKRVAHLKMLEALLESLPQVILGCVV